MNADEVIARLQLQPLPGEGGFFRQTWAATDNNQPHSLIGTAIYYLVTPDSWSALHRLAHDEVFHFYLGDPCQMVMAKLGLPIRQVVLGQRIDQGQFVQHTVPAGVWQGTRLLPGGDWALLGTTMAPGFTPDIFDLASPAAIASLPAGDQEVLRAFLP